MIYVEYPPIRVNSFLPTGLSKITIYLKYLHLILLFDLSGRLYCILRKTENVLLNMLLIFGRENPTGRGPRSEGSSEGLLLTCTGILTRGSSCSQECKQDRHSHRTWGSFMAFLNILLPKWLSLCYGL